MHIKSFENTYLSFLLLVFLIIGFLGTSYYVEHSNRFAGQVYSTTEILRTRALSHRLKRVEYKNAHLESQIAELNLKMAELYDNSAHRQAQTLARFVGLIQQEGPGVEVVLKDTSKPLLLGDNPNTGIIHNTDLVQVVNELRAGGAKAVVINNQPIMNLTGISCSGPIILVNGSRIASPFVIQALGDPKPMIDYLEQPTGFLKELREYGIEVTVTPKDVMIPAYSQDAANI